MQDQMFEEVGPTYATPDSVANTLGLSDPSDPMSLLKFSDSSSPSYDFVRDLIMAAEDEIDLRTRRSWRENYVKDYIVTISGYQADENSVGRPWYYASGGYEITLRKNILPWDPRKGDRLQVRTRMNTWVDLSQYSIAHEDTLSNAVDPDLPPDMPAYRKMPLEYGRLYWFDERDGRLFLRLRYLQPRFNALCISYRYGSTEPVPAGIKRLCNLIVATNILTMDFYSVKVGMGGDISGLRDQAMSRWADEINRLYSSYQRSCSVHSLYR